MLGLLRHGGEAVRLGHAPDAGVELAVDLLLQQGPWLDEVVQLREQLDFGRADAADQMVRAQFAWMRQPGRREQFGQCVHGVAVKAADPLGFVRDNQRALAQRVLGGDAGGATVGVAVLLAVSVRECL